MQALLLYSPSCPHCVTFKPVWAEFVRTTHATHHEIDISANPEVARYFGVSSVPTVVFLSASGRRHIVTSRSPAALINDWVRLSR